MQPFDYYKPATFAEAFELLTLPTKTVQTLAGGTDLIPAIREGKSQPCAVVDIKGLPGLTGVWIEAGEPGCANTAGMPAPPACLCIGAATKMSDIAASELVRTHAQVLAQAAHRMGNEQIRHRATLGGNICTGSPAADAAPPLYVLEAVARIKGPRGARAVPIDEVFVGPKRTCLKPGEIMVAIVIPMLPEGAVGYHERLARRKAGDLAIVNVAALAIPQNGAYAWHIALGAVGPTPRRSFDSEAILAQRLDDEAVDLAAAAAYGCASPIADIRSGIGYRQAMIVNLTRRAIRSILDRLT